MNTGNKRDKTGIRKNKLHLLLKISLWGLFMKQEIDLKELWDIIKNHWLLFIALPLAAALITGALNFFVLKPVYQASSTLIAGKKAFSTGELATELLEDNVLEANRLLAKTYGEIAKSRTVAEQVIAELGLGLTPEQLCKKIHVNQVDDTEILMITVEDHNPQTAANIANATVQKFAAAVIEIKKIDSVSIVDRAVPPQTPVKPRKTMNILIAVLGGIAASLGLCVLLDNLNNTIKSSKEAEELLALPVLGIIFDYQHNED